MADREGTGTKAEKRGSERVKYCSASIIHCRPRRDGESTIDIDRGRKYDAASLRGVSRGGLLSRIHTHGEDRA